MTGILTPLQWLKESCWDALSSRLTRWTKPLGTSLPLATLTDLGRSKSELIAENALLRQQLIVLRREVKRPTFTRTDRMLLVLLARLVRAWQQALVIVQPETLLRWHRELFRLYWKRKSKATSRKPKVAVETIALIREMARDNRLWGAERIRGELMKLGRASVQTHYSEIYEARSLTTATRPEVGDRSRATTPLKSGPATRLQVTDLFFRPLFAFFVIERKLTQGDPRRRHSLADRCLDGTTTAGSDPVWSSAQVSDTG